MVPGVCVCGRGVSVAKVCEEMRAVHRNTGSNCLPDTNLSMSLNSRFTDWATCLQGITNSQNEIRLQ